MSPGITRLLVALIVSLPLIACMSSAPLSRQTDQATLPDEFLKLDRIDADILDPKAKLADLLVVYGRIEPIVEATTVDHLTDENLEDYFRAANRLAFYSMEVKHVSQMRTALVELVRRGHAKRSMRNDMLQAYIQAREFEEARTFSGLPVNADLDKPPAFAKEEANPSPGMMVWSIADDGRTMTPRRVVIDEGVKVIVVSSPWCHFSQAAGQSISKDQQLSAAMQSKALWLMPQVRASDFSDLASWNAKYPDFRMVMVDRQSDWLLIPSWATPGFYFFRDGKLVDSVVGWPGPEQAERLRTVFADLAHRATSH
jgi:hypothetical protein